jgi:hypothetical protein
MDLNPLLIDETTAARDGDQNLSPRAVCPACHTPHPTLTREGLAGGVSWTCVRCCERWDARRLAAVEAYAAWVAARETPVTAVAVR